jgi:hypothetical protein
MAIQYLNTIIKEEQFLTVTILQRFFLIAGISFEKQNVGFWLTD